MLGDTLTAALDDLLAIDPAEVDDEVLHELVVGLRRQANRLEAASWRFVREWDNRKLWADNGSKAPGARLSRETRMRKTAADHLVHRARALAEMPVTAAAFAAGDITADHVDLLASANQPWRNAVFADAEEELVGWCKVPWFSNAATAVNYWKQCADDELCEQSGELVREGRYCSIGKGWRGELNLKAVLDPVGGAILEEELYRICERLRLQDQRDGVTRTVQQRRADALVEMAMRSAMAPETGLRPRPLLTVLLGQESFRRLCELADGTPIAPGQLVPYLSDADIERIIMDPPNRRWEASHRRSFTGALRRIIEVRDRHCQHESGCDVPASRCDVDHIIPRSEGGITCLCNARLLSPPHNRIAKLRNPRRPNAAGAANTDQQALDRDPRCPGHTTTDRPAGLRLTSR